MTNSANNSTVAFVAVRFGQALHMDLSRASDEKLAGAIKTLDDYDTAGKASAHTQDMIDRRIAEIDDETDRRAGVTPVAWNTDITREVHGKSYVFEVPLRQRAAPREEVMDDDDSPAQEQAQLERIERELPDPATQTDGLVPGETSAI